MSSKISELPSVVAANLLDVDVVPVVSAGVTNKVSITNLRTKLGLVVPGARASLGPAYVANNAVYNVRDGIDGVMAAGTGLVDDYAVIQAIATAIPTEGARLYFPKGIYKLTNQVICRGGTQVVGDTLGGSIIKQYGNTNAFRVSSALGCRNVRFADLQIVDAYVGTRTVGYGIDADGTSDVVEGTFERLLISGFIDGFHGTRLMTSSISNVRAGGALRDGIVLDGICTATTLKNTYANGNARYGYHVTGGASYINFESTAADANGDSPYRFGNTLSGSTNVTMDSPGAETNAGHGIHIIDGSRFTIITPNISHITGTTKDCIRIEGGARIKVLGGLLWDSTGYAINILTSATPVASSLIVVEEVQYLTNTLGTVNDPTAVVLDWQGKQFSVGASAGSQKTATLVGRYASNIALAGNVGAGETDLLSTSIPANTLVADGQAIRVRAWGFTAGNANNKTIKLKFGTDTVVTTGAKALNARNWCIDIIIVRSGAVAQFYTGEYGSDDAALLPMLAQYGAGAQTLANANTLKVTGTGTADNDVVQRGMIIEVLT